MHTGVLFSPEEQKQWMLVTHLTIAIEIVVYAPLTVVLKVYLHQSVGSSLMYASTNIIRISQIGSTLKMFSPFTLSGCFLLTWRKLSSWSSLSWLLSLPYTAKTSWIRSAVIGATTWTSSVKCYLYDVLWSTLSVWIVYTVASSACMAMPLPIFTHYYRHCKYHLVHMFKGKHGSW